MSSAAINNPCVITITITADATAGINFVVPRAGTVTGVSVVATATSGGGTALVSKAGSAISNAVACAADTTQATATTINSANNVFTAGQSIRVVTNGAADRGIVYCTFVPAGASLTAA